MIYLDEAILTRWNAKNLNAQVTGGVSRGQVSEDTVLETVSDPYCVWTDVSDSTVVRGTSSRVQNALVQFQVVAADSITCETLCEAIEEAFLNSNQAASNPLAITTSPYLDVVLSCLVMAPYVTEQVGDTVWTGTMTLSIQYARAAGLRPA